MLFNPFEEMNTTIVELEVDVNLHPPYNFECLQFTGFNC